MHSKFWDIKQLKPKDGIYSLSKEDCDAIGKALLKGNNSYQMATFHGSLIETWWSARKTYYLEESFLSWIFNIFRNGIFIATYGVNDRVYISPKGVIFICNNAMKLSKVYDSNLNKIIQHYV